MKYFVLLNNYGKFYLCFGSMTTTAGVRLLSDAAGNLIVSADNLLEFHDET